MTRILVILAFSLRLPLARTPLIMEKAGSSRTRRFLGLIRRFSYSTVTDFARLRGWSTSVPLSIAT